MGNKPVRIQIEQLGNMNEDYMETLMLQTLDNIKKAISENLPAVYMKVLYDNLFDIGTLSEGLYSKMKAHTWYLSTLV